MKQCFSLHKMCELYHICCFISQYPREVKVGLLPWKIYRRRSYPRLVGIFIFNSFR